MDISWLPRAIVPVSISIAFGIFRKYFPAKEDPTLTRYDRHNGPRLPNGVFGFATVSFGLLLGIGGYFALAGMNRLYARVDGPALLHVYPTNAIWWFLPGFAAIALPWPLGIHLLRRSKYKDDAAFIEAESSGKTGFDSYRVMVAMNLFLAVPIGIFTVPAITMHLTFTETDIYWTSYSSLHPQVFSYSDATRATFVDGYRLRDGSFQSHPDLILDFRDGRRFSANAVGDGGTVPSAQEIELLLSKTHLTPHDVQTLDDLK